MSDIKSILTSYSSTERAELELRFDQQQLQKDMYIKAMEHITNLGTVYVEETVDLITNVDRTTKDVHRLVFIDGKRRDEQSTKYRKATVSRSSRVRGIAAYSVVLATETPIVKMGTFNMARIKVRISVTDVPKLDDWRVDFTFTKTIMNPTSAAIKDVQSKMFNKVSVRGNQSRSLVDQVPWLVGGHVVKFELELEHVGQDNAANLTVDHIASVANVIHGAMVGAADVGETVDLQKAIYAAASKLLPPQQAELYRIRHGLKKLWNAVVEVDRDQYFAQIFPDIKQFMATIKADGERVVCHAVGGKLYIIGSTLHVYDLANPIGQSEHIICDAEWVDLRGGGSQVMVFDVMYDQFKHNIMSKPFGFRHSRVVDSVKSMSLSTTSTQQSQSRSPPTIVPKNHIQLTDKWSSELRSLLEGKYNFEDDGIIFNSTKGGYYKMRVYKVKRDDRVAVDLYAKVVTGKIRDTFTKIGDTTSARSTDASGETTGNDDDSMVLLFCTIGQRQFKQHHLSLTPHYSEIFPNQSTHDTFPIHFTPPNNTGAYIHYVDEKTASEMDGHVCEMRWDVASGKWHMLKIRTDRDVDVKRGTYFGNNYYVATIIWRNFINPIKPEDLTDPDTSKLGYFAKHASEDHSAVRSFNNYVKHRGMAKFFKDELMLVDLAGGKGQDVFKADKLGIRNLVVFDIDYQALSILNSRIMNHVNIRGRMNMKITTERLDINQPYLNNIVKIKSVPKQGTPAAMCNFAIHYFMQSKESFRNFANTVIWLSAKQPSFTFMFTCFDGKRVFNMMKGVPEGEVVDFADDGVTKYSIKRMYAGDQFMSAGQKIGVILPFSQGEYYEEYLVNLDYVIGEFCKLGYTVKMNKPFGYWFDSYAVTNQSRFASMTDKDKQYADLYQLVVLHLNRNRGRSRMSAPESGQVGNELDEFKQFARVRQPKIHNGRIKQRWAEHVRGGTKTIEGRLNRGVYAQVMTGDFIEFAVVSDTGDTRADAIESIKVQVLDVTTFNSLEAMFGRDGIKVPDALPGYTEPSDAIALYTSIWNETMVKKYGMLAIHIRYVG